MTTPTLLDIATHNGSDGVAGLIEESIKAHPEIMGRYARTIKGLNYKTLVRTALPTASFRNANEGSASVIGTYENRLVECFTLNPRWECDKAVADRHEDGAAAYIAIEGAGVVEASMRTLASQFYYGAGTGGDAKGHPGLIDAYDATNMVVDAAGTTASTGSSVWAVKFGPQDVAWVYGAGGAMEMEQPEVYPIADGSGNRYSAYVQELLAYPGLQVGSKYAIGRIKKLTGDASCKLTDSMLADLLSKFPTGVVPDVFLMSRRSLKQLQQSRTATNATGAPAPFPNEAFGVPIAITDAILDTESLTL